MPAVKATNKADTNWILSAAATGSGSGPTPLGSPPPGPAGPAHRRTDRRRARQPGRIAEAALAFEARREVLPRGTYLGAPTSVGRTIDLPRGLTDHEWGILVAELRETFGARGTVASHGGSREWTNGNLHAFLEPTTTGHRLRMGTLKGGAVPLMRAGAAGLALGLALLVLFIGEGLPAAAMVAVLIALAGGGIVGVNMFRLPRWAREREAQMEHIAGRVLALAGERPTSN